MASALIGALLGLVLGFATAFFGYRFDTARATRGARIDVYKVVWAKSSLVSMWPRNDDLTYETLEQLQADLCDWYFEEGGVYLSAKSRDVYNDVQETLTSFREEFRSPECQSEQQQNRLRRRIATKAGLSVYRTAPRTGATFSGVKSGRVSPEDYDRVRCSLSKLRTSLTRDLASRKGTFLGY